MPRAYKRCVFDRTSGTSLRTRTKTVSTAKMIKKLGPPTCTKERGEARPKTTKEWQVPMGDSVLIVYDYRGDKWSIGGKERDQKKALKLKKYIES